MRIAIDIRQLVSPRPSGIGYYATEVISRLIKHTDIEWLLFASGRHLKKSDLPKALQSSAPHVITQLYNHSNKWLNFKQLRSQMTLDDALACQVDGWFFPNLDFINTKLPYVITAHDASYEIFPEFYSPKGRLWHFLTHPQETFTKARAVIAVSDSTRHDLQQVFGLADKKISTIKQGLNPIDFSAHIQPSDAHTLSRHNIKGSYFIILSTLEPRKNHLGIIAAYNLFRSTSAKKIRLVIAGKPGFQARRIKKAIARSPYRQDIQYIDYLPSADRAALLRNATALLFPSFYEGFALPVAESLACGTPAVIGSNSAMMEYQSPLLLPIQSFHITDICAGMHILSQDFSHQKHSDFSRSWDQVAHETYLLLKDRLR